MLFSSSDMGERIDHVDGMTIEESEHAIATRLGGVLALAALSARAVATRVAGRAAGNHLLTSR